MYLRLFFTARRGRSEVPVTLLRIRSRIRPRAAPLSFALSISFPRCPFLVLRPALRHGERTTKNEQLLTGCFTSLPSDDLVGVLDAFALVRIGLAQRADLRCCLSDLLLVDAGHGDVSGLAVDGDVDALRDREADRMGVSQLEHHFLPFHLGAIADADDVELAFEALSDTEDVVGDECAHESMRRARPSFVIAARERDDVVLDLHVDAGDDGGGERAFRPFHDDAGFVLLDLDAFRQRNRFIANARHGTLSLPDLTEDLAADSILRGFVARQHTLGCRHDRQTESAEGSGDFLFVAVDAAARARDALDAVNHRLAIGRVLEIDAQHSLRLFLVHERVVADEAFALEDL